MEPQHWHLYVDESGDFRDPGMDITVAGILVPSEQARTVAALRDTLADQVPYLPWPWHAAHLNQPVWTALAWEHTAGRGLSGTRLIGPALEAVQRLAGDDPEMASAVETLARGDVARPDGFGALASRADAALQAGRASDDLRVAVVALNKLALRPEYADVPRDGLRWLPLARAAAAVLEPLAEVASEALSDAVARMDDRHLPRLRDVIALQEHVPDQEDQVLREYQRIAWTVLRQASAALQLQLPTGHLALAGAGESCRGDARHRPLTLPCVDGSPYRTLLYVLVERTVDALALLPGPQTLHVRVLNRPIDHGPRAGQHHGTGYLAKLLRPLGSRHPAVGLVIHNPATYGSHSPATFILADAGANRLRATLRGRLERVETQVHRSTALPLRGGPPDAPRSQLAAHGIAREYIETRASGGPEGGPPVALEAPGLKDWARDQAREWA